MRQKFPIQQGAMHSLTFTLKDEVDVTAFLARCKNTLTDIGGYHPGPLQATLFQKAMPTGMPKSVQAVMQNNCDIPGCLTEMWEKQLITS